MKLFKITFLLLISVLLFMSCTYQIAPRQVSPTVNQEKTAATLEIKRGWETEWERLLLTSKREGKLVIYSSMTPQVRQALVDDFGKKYGLNLEIVIGRGAEYSQKIMSEKRAGITIADIVHGGSSDMLDNLKPRGILDTMEPSFLLPEVTDAEVIKKTWWGGKLLWVDKDQTIFVTFAHPSSNLALNTNLAKPDEIKSWWDLLEPKWKGKIILHDPTISGAGGKWFSVFGSLILGWDYMRNLAKQEPVVLRDARLQVEWLAKGKYPVLIAPRSPIVLEFQEAGAPIWRGVTKEGTYLSGAGGTLALIKDRPHPDAAKLFLNWLVTREGQTTLSKAYGLHSARLDVPTENIPPERVRQPGLEYFWSETEVFLNQEPEFRKLAAEIFGPLIK